MSFQLNSSVITWGFYCVPPQCTGSAQSQESECAVCHHLIAAKVWRCAKPTETECRAKPAKSTAVLSKLLFWEWFLLDSCVISQNSQLSRLRCTGGSSTRAFWFCLALWCNLHSQYCSVAYFSFNFFFFFPSDLTRFALALLIIITKHTWFSVLICVALFPFDLGVCYRSNYLLWKDEARCFTTGQVVLRTNSYLTYLVIWKVFNQFGHFILLLFKKKKKKRIWV